MTVSAIMVIWFGIGTVARFDVERFDTLAECEAAKAAIAENYNGGWDGFIPAANIRCIEVTR